MRSPLFDALNKKAEHLSFHTPGHNGGIVIDSRLDITELSYSDNLLSSEGVILESEREVAKAYGVEGVLFSTSGATALIHTVVRALRNRGEFLLLGEIHKSVYNALRINGVSATLYRGKNLREALEKSGAKVVIVTSPNYFGMVKDLESIAKEVESAGAILVVDASHGAHFAFSTLLPDSATKYAHLVIHSQHKVMKTLTGGATLAYQKKYEKELLRAFREIHTTSPSYLTMLSIESATKELCERGEDLFKRVQESVKDFTLSLVGTPYSVVKTDDFSRLVVKCPTYGDLVEAELEKRGIYAETIYGDSIVFIVTPYNHHNLVALSNALREIEVEKKIVDEIVFPKEEEYVKLTLSGECEEVPLEESVGMVSYGEVGLYPPGTPIITRGEKISSQKVEFLKEHFKNVFGLENGRILVLK